MISARHLTYFTRNFVKPVPLSLQSYTADETRAADETNDAASRCRLDRHRIDNRPFRKTLIVGDVQVGLGRREELVFAHQATHRIDKVKSGAGARRCIAVSEASYDHRVGIRRAYDISVGRGAGYGTAGVEGRGTASCSGAKSSGKSRVISTHIRRYV